MKLFIVLSGLFFSLSSAAMSLTYYGETSIPTGTKFNNTTIGGLSSMVYQNGTLWALSDDKGSGTPARYYEFSLQLANNSVQLAVKDVHLLQGLLDPEGLVRLASGEFLISSEGNNSSRPRQLPRIFRVSANGDYDNDLQLPDKFLPELSGTPSKGLQSNEAFEGLTQTADGHYLFAAAEAALVTDLPAVEKDQIYGDWIRILKFENSGPGDYQPMAEYPYHIDAFADSALGREIYRGVSEALAMSENKIILMERGDRRHQNGLITHTVALYLADLNSTVDVSNVGNLSQAKIKAIDKTKLVDFETDLTSKRPGKDVQNFEGLAWGPLLPDGRKTLLVISDNDFSKKEITELLVFAVEGE